MDALLDFPNELLFRIGLFIKDRKSISALSSICSRFHDVMLPLLYKHCTERNVVALARPSCFGRLDHPATIVRRLDLNVNHWDRDDCTAFRIAMNRSYERLRGLNIEGYYMTLQELFARDTDHRPTSLSSLSVRLSVSKTTVRRDISLMISLFSTQLPHLSINWYLVANSPNFDSMAKILIDLPSQSPNLVTLKIHLPRDRLRFSYTVSPLQSLFETASFYFPQLRDFRLEDRSEELYIGNFLVRHQDLETLSVSVAGWFAGHTLPPQRTLPHLSSLQGTVRTVVEFLAYHSLAEICIVNYEADQWKQLKIALSNAPTVVQLKLYVDRGIPADELMNLLPGCIHLRRLNCNIYLSFSKQSIEVSMRTLYLDVMDQLPNLRKFTVSIWDSPSFDTDDMQRQAFRAAVGQTTREQPLQVTVDRHRLSVPIIDQLV